MVIKRASQDYRSMHESSKNGVDDMITLAELNEGSLLRNVRIRFQRDQIYVRLTAPFHTNTPANLTPPPLRVPNADLHWNNSGVNEPLQADFPVYTRDGPEVQGSRVWCPPSPYLHVG